SRFETGRTAWKRKRQWLANQLKEMPKPIAAFAASDGLALEMLEVCEEMGLAVPEEVAIVGAGNSLLAVDAMRTPISSVDVNMAMIGYEGARLLDHLMARQARPQKIVRISPSRLIVRKSSDAVAVKHEGIARTLRFMWAHCHEPITVNDLARVAAMSIRNFHQIFLATLGRSPGSELNRLRIERAKQLLSDSTDKIDIIAEKCGYEIDNSFRVAFKRVTGVSPQQYRKQNNEAYLGRN
ncbi:MAG TPA: substrate-binding domain-containing protein, partial [Verrucomicrobiae bacterium]|nr:substrate-binding domain-containing protein [Verrucomicrobiae bacterium]